MRRVCRHEDAQLLTVECARVRSKAGAGSQAQPAARGPPVAAAIVAPKAKGLRRGGGSAAPQECVTWCPPCSTAWHAAAGGPNANTNHAPIALAPRPVYARRPRPADPMSAYCLLCRRSPLSVPSARPGPNPSTPPKAPRHARRRLKHTHALLRSPWPWPGPDYAPGIPTRPRRCWGHLQYLPMRSADHGTALARSRMGTLSSPVANAPLALATPHPPRPPLGTTPAPGPAQVPTFLQHPRVDLLRNRLVQPLGAWRAGGWVGGRVAVRMQANSCGTKGRLGSAMGSCATGLTPWVRAPGDPAHSLGPPDDSSS